MVKSDGGAETGGGIVGGEETYRRICFVPSRGGRRAAIVLVAICAAPVVLFDCGSMLEGQDKMSSRWAVRGSACRGLAAKFSLRSTSLMNVVSLQSGGQVR